MSKVETEKVSYGEKLPNTASRETAPSNGGKLEAKTGGLLLQGTRLLLAVSGFVLLYAQGLIWHAMRSGVR